MGTQRTPPAPLGAHDQIMDLVAAFALDAVDDHEVEPIEDHLDTCQNCRDDLRSHHRVLALVGSAVAHSSAPPPHLWSAIAERVRTRP